MSSSTATDDVAGAERGAAFCSAVDDALKNGKPDAVPDESLQRVLSAAVFYPHEYGFVDGTRAGDGDHTDAIVLIDEPTFPGCRMRARPVGVLLMHDDKGPDEKILCVALGDPHYAHVRSLADVFRSVANMLRSLPDVFRSVANVLRSLANGGAPLDPAGARLVPRGATLLTRGASMKPM